MLLKAIRSLLSLFAASVLLSACGGGGDTAPTPVTYTIGGSISGLGSGKTLVLQNNGSNDLTVSSVGAFSFSTKISSGTGYSISVKTQPDGQSCLVSNPSGNSVTADVTSISITCTDITYTLSGIVSGLAPEASVILSNSSSSVTVSANGTFTFSSPLSYKASYSVAIGTQPSGQSCTIQNAAGSNVSTNIDNVTVACSNAPIPILAADGAPLAFGTVTVTSLVDTTSYTARLGRTGELTIPANRVTFPALVKAVPPAGDKALYSYIRGVAQGSASITPMSTLKVAFATKGDPASVKAPLSSQALYDSRVKVAQIFSSIFTAFDVTRIPTVDTSDLFKIYFPTDHTGFDLLLDSIDIKFDTLGNPTVCTRLSNFCKTFDVTNPDTTAIVIPDNEVIGLKNLPFSLCSQTFYNLNVNDLGSNASLYSTGFYDAGINAATYRQHLLDFKNNNYANNDAVISLPKFINVDKNSINTYVFAFNYIDSSSHDYLFTQTVRLKSEGGKCVLIGDQLPFSVNVLTEITNVIRLDSNSVYGITGNPLGGVRIRASSVDRLGYKLSTLTDTDGLPIFMDSSGASLPVKTLDVKWCDYNNACAPMTTLTLTSLGQFVGDVCNRVNGCFNSFDSLGLTSSDKFYNGNPYPVQITLMDKSGVELKKLYVPIVGNFVSAAEQKTIPLPTIPSALLSLTTLTDTSTSFQVSVPSGVLVNNATLKLQSINLLGQPYFSTGASSTSIKVDNGSLPVTSLTFNKPISDQFTFRSIALSGFGMANNPFQYTVTYFWSPTCTQCGTY